MRMFARGSALLAVTWWGRVAFADPPPTPEPTPVVPESVIVVPAPAPTTAEPTALPEVNPAPLTSAPSIAPVDERRPAQALSVAVPVTAADARPTDPKTRPRYDALPLALEARFGVNGRLGTSFAASAQEELLDTSVALGAYLAWRREYALGLELEHAGLGGVRALSSQNPQESIDARYSATAAFLGLRVFPVRAERLDAFLNLRLGLAFQHVDALGTRSVSSSITVPASSFGCSEWDGPGFALGAALGVSYRLARHFALVSRIDATAERLEGGALGTCAEGLGSVASIAGTAGLAFEFETAPR